MFRLVSTVRAPRIGAQNADQIKIADFNGDRRPDIFGIDNGIDKMPFTGGAEQAFLVQCRPVGRCNREPSSSHAEQSRSLCRRH